MRALRGAAPAGLQKGGRRRIACRSRLRAVEYQSHQLPTTSGRAPLCEPPNRGGKASVPTGTAYFRGMASERFDTCRNRVGNVGASIVRRRRIVHLLVALLFPRIDIAISVSGRRLSPSRERALATPRWMTDMSVGSRGGGSESEPQASAPILSDIEALVLASAVLGLAYALLS
jgi:hypothetical protein